MEQLKEIFSNTAITIPLITLIVTQLMKVIYDLKKYKKINIRRVVGSGGMPSSHAAYVTSLATIIGIKEGWDSLLFGIAFAFAVIVMYDAAGVRRAAGKQAQVINKIIMESQMSGRLTNLDVKLKELIGHTPVEVVIGAIIGVLFGFLFS